MNRLLKLQHHKHTGKVLHHRHTSYRALFLIVIMVGVLMVITSQTAKADSYDVTATVPAPMPSGSPVIRKFRATATVVHTPSVAINGTCPIITPAVVIALYDNSALTGSQQCSPQGIFNIPISISEGTHSILATVITITGQVGASSDPVIITYAGPESSQNSPQVSSKQPSVKPLRIISDNALLIFGTNSDAVWSGAFTGGTLPYKVKITWGDGNVQELSGLGAEKQTIRHHYSHFVTYQIKIQLADAGGRTTAQSLTAITFASAAASQGSPGFLQSITDPRLSATTVLYSIYIVMVLILLGFWRKEHLHRLQLAYVPITKRKRKTRRQA